MGGRWGWEIERARKNIRVGFGDTCQKTQDAEEWSARSPEGLAAFSFKKLVCRLFI
jgi:hypothetical protein